ncbi:MAG: plasmid pRiA4b ORF-3 family protein (plasmid) [Candidatus Symbiodolus clandestinus]
MNNVVPIDKQKVKKDLELLELHIELAGISPVIWRRILIPSTTTLGKLHTVIQLAFSWRDYHLHEFSIRDKRYGIPDPELNWGEPIRSEKGILLTRALNNTDNFKYIYDFGDDWEHIIKVEKRLPYDPDRGLSIMCLEGKNAAPPEDVGGIPGYEEFVEVMGNSQHPEHHRMLGWYGELFDPTRFDKYVLNSFYFNLKI